MQDFLHGFALFHILFGDGHHQLDAVQLVGFTGAGIVIDGDDVGFGELAVQFLHGAAAGNVVGQTGEGLHTDDIGHAAFDQLDHFPGEEPAFTGLIADGYHRGGFFRQIFDMCRWIKPFALS